MLNIYQNMLKPFKRLKGDAVVIVYGSVASGESRTDSDIDIAVISNDRKVWMEADSIADRILFEHGKVVSVAKLTPGQFREKPNSRFAGEILKGVVIHGKRSGLEGAG